MSYIYTVTCTLYMTGAIGVNVTQISPEYYGNRVHGNWVYGNWAYDLASIGTADLNQ